MGSQRVPRQALFAGSEPPRPLTKRIKAASPMAVGMWSSLCGGWTSAPRLADILEPSRNNFSVLRLVLALAVLVSHAMFLATGSGLAEPFVGATGYSLGQYGVQGFFILSGVLVTQSLVVRGDLFDYARARAFRIFPALIVCVLLTALALGPVLSLLGVSAYFKSLGVYAYIAKTLSLSTGSAQLPGLFLLNPADGVVNQSLWTLKYEVSCYLLLGGLAALVRFAPSRRFAATAVAAAWVAAMLAVRPSLVHDGNFFSILSYFALFFGAGVVAFLLRDRIRLAWHPLPGLALLFYATLGTQFAEISSALLLCYGILWVASLNFGGLSGFANANDYSYGTYIYSYPVTQTLLALWPDIKLLPLLVVTTGVTLLFACLSWELIERPALGVVRRWRQTTTGARQAVPESRLATVVAGMRPGRVLPVLVKGASGTPGDFVKPSVTSPRQARIINIADAVHRPLIRRSEPLPRRP